MNPGRRAARLPRHPLGIVVACTAWLSLSPSVRAEDRPSTDEEPEPVSLSHPADGEVLPAARAAAAVVLSWRPSRAPSPWYFTEVLTLGRGDPSEVFAGYTRQTELRLRLGQGKYAWRVITVSRAGARYSASPWRSFSAGGLVEGAR